MFPSALDDARFCTLRLLTPEFSRLDPVELRAADTLLQLSWKFEPLNGSIDVLAARSSVNETVATPLLAPNPARPFAEVLFFLWAKEFDRLRTDIDALVLNQFGALPGVVASAISADELANHDFVHMSSDNALQSKESHNENLDY